MVTIRGAGHRFQKIKTEAFDRRGEIFKGIKYRAKPSVALRVYVLKDGRKHLTFRRKITPPGALRATNRCSYSSHGCLGIAILQKRSSSYGNDELPLIELTLFPSRKRPLILDEITTIISSPRN